MKRVPVCAEQDDGSTHINDNYPDRPICRTCDDDPGISILYPLPESEK